MSDDAGFRANKVIERLNLRVLELKKPDQQDMSDALQALTLVLEMQVDLAREQRQISERLSRLS